MGTIRMNDGTVVSGDVLDNGDGRIIFVYLEGMTVIQGVTLFGDSDKSAVLIATNFGEQHRYEGYTELWSASHEYGNCNLVMKKAVS